MLSLFANRLSLRVLPALSLAYVFVLSTPTHAADAWPSTGVNSGAAYERIQAALDQDTALDFVDTPLEQVAAFLRDQHDIEIQLDHVAMNDVGIALTRSLKGISLGSALKLMLSDLDMTYIIQHDVLLLTTTEAAASRPEVRVYNVSKLLGDGTDSTELAATISQALYAGGGGFFSVPSQMGGGMGGMGAPPLVHSGIIPFNQLLIVRHTTIGQDDVAKLLAAIGAALEAGAGQ